jgi:alpha-glucosidase
MHKNWLSLLVFGVIVSAVQVRPAQAEWHYITSMVAGTPQGNSITFRNPQALVTVTALAPDVVRVRMAHGTSFGPDYSYAVVKTDWPSPQVEFTHAKQMETLRTADLEVRVQLSPFRISYYNRAGRLISKDSDSAGMAWDDQDVRCWKWMPPDEHYFGLGEKGDDLDKRGHTYVMWNTDAYGWGPTTDPLYVTIPFFLALRSGNAYGLFFDNTYRSSFDMGKEYADRYSFGAEGGELNYYFINGPGPKQVLERYTGLTGRMPMPARWQIGYHQSRYSYYPESMVRFIAQNFRDRKIPCDALFLDIHYMDGYRIFTWDKSRFPDPSKMLSDLRREGFHVVTIIDPGVKQDPNYWVYQQGLAGDDFVKMPDGKVFIGKVWPGDAAFPDFTWHRVRDWWGSLYKGLIQDGVAGFWNDMNEPSVFEVPSKTMPPDAIFYDHGLHSPHTKIHNVYGMLMSEGTREGILKYRPEERPLVITRDTYAGGQRYAAVWTGDNSSTWEHLRLSLPELMNMGLSGLSLVGADIGGFALSPSPDLYTRWLEAGVFYPYCRTHTELASREQDPWSYGIRREDINRQSIKLRYRLLPYFYNAFHQSAETGLPVMRALLLDYPDDPRAVASEDEFLLGDDLLVAPVVKDGEITRSVYLPKDEWYDFWSGRRYVGPAQIEVDAPLDRIPLFARGGAVIPTQQAVEYTDQAPINPLTLEVYPRGDSSRAYYEDDGLTYQYQHGVDLEQTFTVKSSGKTIRVETSARQGSYEPPARSLEIKVHGEQCAPRQVESGERALVQLDSQEKLDQANSGWYFDEASAVVFIKVPDNAGGVTTQVEK